MLDAFRPHRALAEITEMIVIFGGDGEMQRRLTAGGGHGTDTALQCGNALLQHRHRGVGDARVEVPGPLQVEQGGCVLGIVEHIGRGLVDGHRPRARGRIGPLAGV